MTTSITDDRAAAWSRLLHEAVTRPGVLLDAYSAFWNYSIGNQLLALTQCEKRGLAAGPLATFPVWKERGRFVRKGERALMLCQPLTFKNKEKQAASDPDAFIRFCFKPRWFVLAQTEGEEYTPEAPADWDDARALHTLQIERIPFELMTGNVLGYARRRQVAVSPLSPYPHKTLFHELGHVLLGHTAEADFNDAESTPRNLREVEAESVALILTETLRLDGAPACRGYIQNWYAGRCEIPERSAQKIFHAADQILRAGRPVQEGAETNA